jgi:predicted O-methyltransferase YrrM
MLSIINTTIRTKKVSDQIICIVSYWRKKLECNGTVDLLFIDFEKAYNLSYNFLIKFDVLKNLTE